MDFSVGQFVEIRKEVTQELVNRYADVVDDNNPLHVNPDVPNKFGGTIAHGMLTAGFMSGLLGQVWPGPGTIYLSQSWSFLAPVRIPAQLNLRATIVELLPKGGAKLKTEAFVGNMLVADGDATVKLPKFVSQAA